MCPSSDRETTKTHDLKVDPIYFMSLYDGRKPFELRKNDRDYKVGDWLHLMEFDRVTKSYSGRFVNAEITYITDYPDALKDGYVCLGIKMGCKYGN